MVGGNVISLFRPRVVNRDWNNQELAEFYRVESALISVGFHVDTDRGLTDEGEPWFIFVDAESGDVIVHCARTDGAYLIASAAFAGVLRGVDFRALMETFLEHQPLALPRVDTPEQKNNIHLHPSAFLVALVATAFFKLSSTGAEAAALDADGASDRLGMELDKRQALVVLAAVAVVTSQATSDVGVDWVANATATVLRDNGSHVESHGGVRADLPALEIHARNLPADDDISGAQTAHLALTASADWAARSVLETVLADVLYGDIDFDASPQHLDVQAPPVSDGGGQGVLRALFGQQVLDFGSDMASLDHAMSNMGDHTDAVRAEDAGDVNGAGSATSPASTSEVSVTSLAVAVVNTPSLDMGEVVAGAQGIGDMQQSQPDKTDVSIIETEDVPNEVVVEEPVSSENSSGIDVEALLNLVAGELDVTVSRIRIEDEVRSYDLEARALVLDFIRQESDSRTFSSGHDLIVYDSRLLEAGDKDITFMTWSIEGGSTISLLGVLDYDLMAA